MSENDFNPFSDIAHLVDSIQSASTQATASEPEVAAAPDPDWFLHKWEPLTKNLTLSYNLLKSPSENDFSAALIKEDDQRHEEFISDLVDLLVELGKLPSKDAHVDVSAFDLALRANRATHAGRGGVPRSTSSTHAPLRW